MHAVRTGKRNEPINSASGQASGFRHFAVSPFCFLNEVLFELDISVKAFRDRDCSRPGWRDGAFAPVRYPSSGLFITFYSGEFDPGSGWTLATGLTHASRGETALSARTLRTSTGARVSNAYPTFPSLRDNLPKGRLIPHGLHWRHQRWSKAF